MAVWELILKGRKLNLEDIYLCSSLPPLTSYPKHGWNGWTSKIHPEPLWEPCARIVTKKDRIRSPHTSPELLWSGLLLHRVK